MTEALSKHPSGGQGGAARDLARVLAVTLGLTLVVTLGARTAAARPASTPPHRQAVQAAPDTPRHQRAAHLLAEARQDRKLGFLARAEARLRTALDLWPHPVIRYDLALVLSERGNPVEAAEQLRQVLRELEGSASDPTLRQHTEQRLRELEVHTLAWVTVTSQTRGAKLYIGDEHVHTVAEGRCGAHACPKRTAVRSVAVKPSGAPHLFVAVMPHGDPPVVVEQRLVPGSSYLISFEERRAGRRWRHLTWEPGAAVGTGALLLIAGVVLHERAAASYRDFEEGLSTCPLPCDLRSLEVHRRRGDRLRTFGIVGYSVGATTAAAGLALFYLNRRVAYRRKDLTIAPLVGPAGGGALVTGRF